MKLPWPAMTKALTASQCRAARALIHWNQIELATAANVGVATLCDFERGTRQPRTRTLKALRHTLEKAGIQFIDPNGQGPGVVLQPNLAG